MAYYKYSIDEKKIARFIKEGRGKGDGMAYKPWIRTDEVPSTGRVHRVYCSKTNREHHLLSDNEYLAFLIFYWDDNVIDIREQYPIIDRNTTKDIAASLKIKHPFDTKTKTTIVMTIDFLVTYLINGHKEVIAYDIKETKDLDIVRTRNKLEISRIYCEEIVNLPWEMRTEIELKTTFTKNLDWILYGERSAETMSLEVINALMFWLFKTKKEFYGTPICICCSEFDSTYGHGNGIGLAVLRVLLAAKVIITDLSVPLLQDQAVKNFNINMNRYLEFV